MKGSYSGSTNISADKESAGRISTCLTSLNVSFGSEFFNAFGVALITTAAAGCTDEKAASRAKKEKMTEALIAIDRIRSGGGYIYSLSQERSNTGKVYVMYPAEADRRVMEIAKKVRASCRKIYSQGAIPLENLCDLAAKYTALAAISPGAYLSRNRGVSYKVSEKAMVEVSFSADRTHAGDVIISAEGVNIQRTKETKKTDGGFPFIFTDGGLKVYTDKFPEGVRRYVYGTQKGGKLTKTKAMVFGNGEEKRYEESGSRLRFLAGTVSAIEALPGVRITPVRWTGTAGRERIGKNEEDLRSMDTAAALTAEKAGIRLETGEGVDKNVVRFLEQNLSLFFSNKYEVKASYDYEKEKVGMIRVRTPGIAAVKAAGMVLFPTDNEDTPDGCTEFYAGKAFSGMVLYAPVAKTEPVRADLYGEDGSCIGHADLKQKKKSGKAVDVFSTATPVVRQNGLFTVRVIKDKEPGTPYEKALHVQHITADTVLENSKNLQPLCLNILYQLVIKKDIEQGCFTFLSIPEFTGYRFVFSDRTRTACVTMQVEDGTRFLLRTSSAEEEMTLQDLCNDYKEEKYVIIRPDGRSFAIEKSDYRLMPDPAIRADNTTRKGKENNVYLAPFLDYVTYSEDGEQYYTAGWDLVKSNSLSYTWFPVIRKFEKSGPFEVDMDRYIRLLNVPFVRMSQKNTVVPFPFKYLREYASLIKGNEDAAEQPQAH